MAKGSVKIWNSTLNQWMDLPTIKGDTGAIGPTGAKGDKGDKGDTGEIGPIGPQGDKGEDNVHISTEPPESIGSFWYDPEDTIYVYTLKQTVGDSEEEAMSQKATTDAINNSALYRTIKLPSTTTRQESYILSNGDIIHCGNVGNKWGAKII